MSFIKIAIHPNPGSFSDRWIEYCQNENIPYKIVNCYDSDIITQLADCDALLWHWHHSNYKDQLFARQLILSLEMMGKQVFPNSKTCWHFDDKLGQKYLLEAIGAPLVPTHVFYDQKSALAWLETTTFPKVFKLRGGAGSANVDLIKNIHQAKIKIKQGFNNGFSSFSRIKWFGEWFRKYQEKQISCITFFKGIKTLFISTNLSKMNKTEKGYVYFQDFIPHNDFDIRIIVVGDKAIGIKRMCRKGDFRASGSGDIIYDPTQIDSRCLQIAFTTSKKLQAQCLAYDFVFNEKDEPLMVEISYGFTVLAYDHCPGYWDQQLNWHEGMLNVPIELLKEWVIKLNHPFF